jgi:uncharacterized repeat protein (TIGR03847 family)
MPNLETELNPVDFITVGTVGPKGQRVFHLQAGKADQLVSLTIEKEQARALSEALRELLDDLAGRYPERTTGTVREPNMELRDPLDPLFRVAQMGLGYDEDRDMVVLVAQELVIQDMDDEEDTDDMELEVEPDIVRLWCSRAQMRALSDHALSIVQAGRPEPRQNGRLVYYWT